MFLDNSLEGNNLNTNSNNIISQNQPTESQIDSTSNSNNDTSSISTNYSILSSLVDVNVILTTVYLIIFLIGVIGNICNCLVIADSRNKYMKTATNYYLFSLSVSDLLLLIFGLPHDIVNLWHPSPYMFNQFVCISRGWISEASTYASVLVIVAFTVERYLAICHPLKSHTLSRISRTVKIIIIIWLVASTCALFVVMQYGIITIVEKKPNGQDIANPQCTTVNRNETIFELSSIIFFIIPMAVITILYVNLGYHLRKKTSLIRRQNKIKKQRQRINMAKLKLEQRQEVEEENDQKQKQQQQQLHSFEQLGRVSKFSSGNDAVFNSDDIQESFPMNYDYTEQSVKKSKSDQKIISNWLSSLSRKLNGRKKQLNDRDELNLSQITCKLEESCYPNSDEFVCIESIDYPENSHFHKNNSSINDNNKKDELNSTSDETNPDDIDHQTSSNWPSKISKVTVTVCSDNLPDTSQVPVRVQINEEILDDRNKGTKSFNISDSSLSNNCSISPLADKLPSSLSESCIPLNQNQQQQQLARNLSSANLKGDTSFCTGSIQLNDLSSSNEKTDNVDRNLMIEPTNVEYDIEVLATTTPSVNDDVSSVKSHSTCLDQSLYNKNDKNDEIEPLQEHQFQNSVENKRRQFLHSSSMNRAGSVNAIEAMKAFTDADDSNVVVGKTSIWSQRDIRMKHSASFVSRKLFAPLLTNNHRHQSENLKVQNGSTKVGVEKEGVEARKHENEYQVIRSNLSLKNKEPIALNSTASAGNLQSVIKMLEKKATKITTSLAHLNFLGFFKK